MAAAGWQCDGCSHVNPQAGGSCLVCGSPFVGGGGGGNTGGPRGDEGEESMRQRNMKVEVALVDPELECVQANTWSANMPSGSSGRTSESLDGKENDWIVTDKTEGHRRYLVTTRYYQEPVHTAAMLKRLTEPMKECRLHGVVSVVAPEKNRCAAPAFGQLLSSPVEIHALTAELSTTIRSALRRLGTRESVAWKQAHTPCADGTPPSGSPAAAPVVAAGKPEGRWAKGPRELPVVGANFSDADEFQGAEPPPELEVKREPTLTQCCKRAPGAAPSRAEREARRRALLAELEELDRLDAEDDKCQSPAVSVAPNSREGSHDNAAATPPRPGEAATPLTASTLQHHHVQPAAPPAAQFLARPSGAWEPSSKHDSKVGSGYQPSVTPYPVPPSNSKVSEPSTAGSTCHPPRAHASSAPLASQTSTRKGIPSTGEYPHGHDDGFTETYTVPTDRKSAASRDAAQLSGDESAPHAVGQSDSVDRPSRRLSRVAPPPLAGPMESSSQLSNTSSAKDVGESCTSSGGITTSARSVGGAEARPAAAPAVYSLSSTSNYIEEKKRDLNLASLRGAASPGLPYQPAGSSSSLRASPAPHRAAAAASFGSSYRPMPSGDALLRYRPSSSGLLYGGDDEREREREIQLRADSYREYMRRPPWQDAAAPDAPGYAYKPDAHGYSARPASKSGDHRGVGGAASSGHCLHPAAAAAPALPAGSLPLSPPPPGGGGGGGGGARSVSRSPSPTTARYPRADPYKPAAGKSDPWIPAPGFTRKSSSDMTDVF
ncbi:hypothetical protein DIPPA_03073 [Diplonema papillatum]|nr:hypothetical protein DIPPA_03073 [Diplonema papillatum]